ncbi:MAG: tetratricopeptide repeat protein [Polyangiaceae bacterium]|nr:tetratricopeptide repeat protein [Polyangiaceae bacterium]
MRDFARFVTGGLVWVGLAASAAACAPARSPAADASVRRGPSARELAGRGQAFASVGDWTRAEEYFSAALQAGAEPRGVLPRLVHACIEASRYRAAAEYVREYLPDDPDNPKLHLLYGLLEAAIGDRERARHELESVLRDHPDDSAGHYALAVLLRDSGADPAGASEHFREYLRLAPYGEHAAQARAALREELP